MENQDLFVLPFNREKKLSTAFLNQVS